MNNPKGMFDGTPTIADIVENKDGIYDGDLIYYFKIVMNHARNLSNPYHNFRHIFYVLWMCYDACLYYMALGKMTGREARNLLVAVIFHDFDHSGKTGEDDLELTRACRAFTRHHHPSDASPNFVNIIDIMLATKFPHKKPSSELCLCEQIIRDADLSQTLDTSWIQQIIFGLGTETGLGALGILKSQPSFLYDLHFHTNWAKERFSDEMIRLKIHEANQYLSFIE